MTDAPIGSDGTPLDGQGLDGAHGDAEATIQWFRERNTPEAFVEAVVKRFDKPAQQRDLYDFMAAQEQFDVSVLLALAELLGNDGSKKADAVKATSKDLLRLSKMRADISGGIVFEDQAPRRQRPAGSVE